MSAIENDTWQVSLERLENMERDSKDLARAKALIERLRVENNALKAEASEASARNRAVASAVYRSIHISGSAHKKWAVKYLAGKLGIVFK